MPKGGPAATSSSSAAASSSSSSFFIPGVVRSTQPRTASDHHEGSSKCVLEISLLGRFPPHNRYGEGCPRLCWSSN